MYLCELCSQQFPKNQAGKQQWLLHRAEHKKNPTLGQAGETATGKQIKKSMSAEQVRKERKPKKLELSYVWAGECSACLSTLDSITIEAGQPKGKIIVVAYCGRCKKEISHRQVEKL